MKMPLLAKLANAEDELTGDAFEIFEFRKVGNRRGRLRLERDKARDAETVFAALIRKNAELPADNAKALETVQAAIDSRPREQLLYAARCGWQARRRAFVTPRTVLGPTRRRRLEQPLWINTMHNLPMRSRGSLDEWKAEVAARAAHSAPATLAISAAFAAPLLALTGRLPFGINLFGPSKIGKTTAALAGASVIGIGQETDLPNWAATAAARGEQARTFNDMLMPINETGLLAGSKKAAYAEIRTLIYSLGEGRERRRHSASSYSAPAAAEEFRTIFLSTAERSFTEYARLAQEVRDEGEYARCLDVPAQSRRKTIISFFPQTLASTNRSRWARKEVIELRRACESQHGTAFGPFVDYLIEHDAELDRRIRLYSGRFLRAVKHRSVEGALEHAADNFALIYAGGCLAIDSNVLPWSKSALCRSINLCFEKALDDLGRYEDASVRARNKLRSALKVADIVKLKRTDMFGEAEHHGFYRTQHGARTYIIHAKRFRRWFSDEAEVRAALEYLEAKGRLQPKRAKKMSESRATSDWAEQTPKWPNGKSVRSIVFTASGVRRAAKSPS